MEEFEKQQAWKENPAGVSGYTDMPEAIIPALRAKAYWNAIKDISENTSFSNDGMEYRKKRAKEAVAIGMSFQKYPLTSFIHSLWSNKRGAL